MEKTKGIFIRLGNIKKPKKVENCCTQNISKICVFHDEEPSCIGCGYYYIKKYK